MVVPPLVACAAAALLYALGGRGRRRGWREASFYAGVLTVLAALEPPFDTLADSSFAVHMAQHVLLIGIAPPLLVLGRPWPRLWLSFPLPVRRSAARGLALGSWSAPLRAGTRALTRPPVAVAALALGLAVWHLPVLYGDAVASQGVHVLEHLTFFATALLFWGPLLEAPPVRARIDHLRRAGWFALGVVPGWILGIVLADSSRPLYPVYALLSHRAGGLSPLGDQQIAAGVMWVPGSLSFLTAFVVSVYRWLDPAASAAGEPRPEELSWT